MDSVESVKEDYDSIDPSQRKPIKVYTIHTTLLTVEELDVIALEDP